MWFVIIALIFFIIYPYVLYPLILYVIKKEDTPAEETEGSLSVSLYIAAYNEEGIIGEKLDNSLRLKTTLTVRQSMTISSHILQLWTYQLSMRTRSG